MSEIVRPGGESPFDAIRRLDPDTRAESWDARELQPLLEYAQWRRFEEVIERAKIACKNSGHDVASNFAATGKVSGSRGPAQKDYELSRYACYLIAMEADSNKTAVAEAKTYFAVKTRQAELAGTSQFEIPTNLGDALRLAAEQYDRAESEAAARQIEAAARQAAEQERDELAPAAESWEALVQGEGDYSLREAAQMLDRDPRITRTIGQNQLGDLLREIGWADKKLMPYQAQVNSGRLVARMREWRDRETREVRTSYQVRITPKGMDALRGHLTGAKPLGRQLRLATFDDGGVA